MTHIRKLKKNSSDFVEEYNELIHAIRHINVLDPKTKHLVFVGIKSLMGDILSAKYHAQLAKRHGATSEEIMQTFLISSLNIRLNEQNKKTKIEMNTNILEKIINVDRARFNRKGLGRVIENKLFQAGINSLETLKNIGSEQAFIQVLEIDPLSTLRVLYTLECTINNINRDALSKKRQDELLGFYNNIKRGRKSDPKLL